MNFKHGVLVIHCSTFIIFQVLWIRVLYTTQVAASGSGSFMKLQSSCCLGPSSHHKTGQGNDALFVCMEWVLAGHKTPAAKLTHLSIHMGLPHNIATWFCLEQKGQGQTRENIQDGSLVFFHLFLEVMDHIVYHILQQVSKFRPN